MHNLKNERIIHVYIYIYICVCVCVCVSIFSLINPTLNIISNTDSKVKKKNLLCSPTFYRLYFPWRGINFDTLSSAEHSNKFKRYKNLVSRLFLCKRFHLRVMRYVLTFASVELSILCVDVRGLH